MSLTDIITRAVLGARADLADWFGTQETGAHAAARQDLTAAFNDTDER